MNFDDYEVLPSTNVGVNMTAGAIAGVLEHCVMYPLDSVKTRMQSMSPLTAGHSVITTFSNMVKNEGIMRPIRGMGAVVLGAGPAHAFYFGTYERTKEVLSKHTNKHQLSYIAAATMATLIHDAISNPTEVIKQRLQMYNSPYKSVITCCKAVYKAEGFKAFYRSYLTQLIMNLPYQAIHFTTYEYFQNHMNKDRKYNPPVHVLAGGAAGASAAAITTPLDVVKTLLNTQETGSKGMVQAVRQIYKMAGPLGFIKGLVPRVLYSMPATAICWSTYEFFKFLLTKETETRPQYTTPSPKEVVSLSVEKLRSGVVNNSEETTIGLRYALPNTIVSADASTDIPTSIRDTSTLKTRELPAMSGAGMYGAINMNTMHSDNNVSFDRRRNN